MKKIKVEVYRYNPALSKPATFQTYQVNTHKKARVLDILAIIHNKIDPTLSYAGICGRGQCGGCAVKVNGTPVLACMEEAQDKMRIEPISLIVKKDLLVVTNPLLKNINSFKPTAKPKILSPKRAAPIEHLRKCIQCFSCNSVCPTFSHTKGYIGPAAMCQEMRLILDTRSKSTKIDKIVKSGLFNCTSCKACWRACPKKINIFVDAIEKLRAIAHNNGLSLAGHLEFAERIKKTNRSVEAIGQIFLENVPKTITPKGKTIATVGLFVGCLPNMIMSDIAFDLVAVLKRNGIKIIIPKDQVCCGSPLIRTGQLQQVPGLKKQNIACFSELDIDAIITMCSGCGMTLKQDYVMPFKVMDATEFLAQYRIEPPEYLASKALYHDPCHLLYGQEVKSQPRKLLSGLVDIIEMPHFCCGGGGGFGPGAPKKAKKITQTLVQEIIKIKPDLITTTCPFCQVHIGNNINIPVKNIFTLLHEGYQQKDKHLLQKEKSCP